MRSGRGAAIARARRRPWRYFVLFAIALVFGCGAFALVSLFIRRVYGRAAGLVALLAGLGLPYATYWPLKFNHNISVMPFWALVIVVGYVGAREAWRLQSPLSTGDYPETDGLALAARYWAGQGAAADLFRRHFAAGLDLPLLG